MRVRLPIARSACEKVSKQADSLAVPPGSRAAHSEATPPAITDAHVSAPSSLSNHNNISLVPEAPEKN